jgi:AAA domain
MHTAEACASSADPYDFRKDFDSITRPVLVRYLKHLGYGVDEGEDENEGDLDPTYYTDAKTYAWRLFKALQEAQESGEVTSWTIESARALANERLEDIIGTTPFSYDHAISWTENSRRRAYAICAAKDRHVLAYATSGIVAPPLGSPDADALIKWHRDNAAETVKYFETEHEKVVAEAEADREPVDIDRAVRLGTEIAQKQNADGNLPFFIDTGPEAVAYATDRLKSKIWRNAVHNPITEVHQGFLSYRFLKGMRGGDKVVYIDHYKRQQAEASQPSQSPGGSSKGQDQAKREEAPLSRDAKTVECMFQRVGLLKAKPREWVVRGLVPRNEVGNPFGRPDSFKGVFATQLVAHIAGGVDFLGMEVKQGPSAYFAAERGEQAKRRIKGHIQRLGLPSDLPCYYGGKPIDLLVKADLDFLIANIHAIEKDAGAPLVTLVVDTQSRTMGGDENSTKDGAAYAKAVEAIREATEATLWIISHTGHGEDAQDRPRGSSALLGAYDTFYRHKKIDEQHGEIKITIDRDGLGEKEFTFAVELYDTGAVNEDGEPVMVPYLEAAAAPAKFTFKKGGEPSKTENPTRAESEALRALHKAIKKHGAVTPKGEGVPAGEITVHGREWRDAYYELFRTREPATLRQGFSRSTKSLIAKKLVNEYGSRRWPAE